MPTRVSASLYVSDDVIYEVPSSGRLAQAMLFRALRASDPDLASRVHASSSRGALAAPYSVTLITAAERGVRGIFARVERGDYVRLTIKLLRDDLVGPLVDGLFDARLDVNGTPVEVGEAKVKSVSYEDLLASSPVARGFRLDLTTPALITKSFPPPLHRLLARPMAAWNAHAPEHLRLPAAALLGLLRAEPTTPSALTSRAVRMWFGNEEKILVGFDGTLSYSLRLLRSFEGRVASALLRYAEYSGVGRKTTVGFGSVWVRFWRRRGRRAGRR